VEHQDAAAAELQLTRSWQRRKRNRGRRGRVWSGVEGAGPGLKHGKVAARARQGGSECTAGGSECSAGEPRGANSQQGDDTVQKFQNSNSTSNIPLTPIFRASVTSKPLSFGTIRSNKNCRATRRLQLFLKHQSLIQPGWRDTRLQRGVHEN
jgi:hypothetical protein